MLYTGEVIISEGAMSKPVRVIWALLLVCGIVPLRGQEPAAPSPAPAATPSGEPVAMPVQASPLQAVPAGAGQAGAQPAKNPDGSYTIRSNARLVVLDVVVSNARGEVVRDLTRDDFHVTEAGEPQTIQNFEASGTVRVSPDATINSTADLDRLAPRAPVNIILLDEFNTRFEDMAFARYSLKKYLEKQPDKLSMPTMLIAVSLTNFSVLRDYTQDKQEVLTALDHHFAAYPWQVHQGQWIAERYSTAFATLMRVAEAVVGHQGHKNMIWIGRGFPAINISQVPIDTQTRLNNIVQDTVNLLRDARVTLYSIDPAGVMMTAATYGNAAEFNDPLGGNYQFNALAKATGGKALYGRNDVDAEIGRTVEDGASFYTLTYRPTDTSLDPQKFRKIKVTVDRPGLVATTREGYYLQRRPYRVNPDKPSRMLAFDLNAAATSTMVYDGLPVTVTPSPEKPNDYVVRVGSRGVSWTYATDTMPRFSEVVVTVSTFDKKGKLLKEQGKVMKLGAPKDAPGSGPIDVDLRIPWTLEADAKAVRARFVVRMSRTGRIGTADVALGGNPPPSP